MFSPVASTIFAYRRADKTANGDVGSGAVAAGQCTGVIKEVSRLDNAIAASAKSAVSVFEDLAKSNKAFDYAGKCLNFAADNVNPLICAAGAIKVATSDDKIGTGVTEATALSVMFAGEGFMKKYLPNIFNAENISSVAKKGTRFNILKPIAEAASEVKIAGRIGAVLKGLTFVGGSIAGYAVGQSFGEKCAVSVKSKLGLNTEKINQKT